MTISQTAQVYMIPGWTWKAQDSTAMASNEVTCSEKVWALTVRETLCSGSDDAGSVGYPRSRDVGA